ncbi:MAG: sigma-70 family RNA polymerase sigma factor [Pseudomonadota bacterium]
MTHTPNDSEDDAALLARIGAGDEAAMKVIYDRYAGPLRFFVRTWLSDEHEGGDVVHEAMLAVWTQATRFEGRSSAKSWIFGIARNKAIDRVRATSRMVPTEPEHFDDADESQDLQHDLEAMQDAAVVRECVEALGEAHRRAVHLAFFEDMAYRDIADVEGCPVGTIKTRILHAKRLIVRCVSLKRRGA